MSFSRTSLPPRFNAPPKPCFAAGARGFWCGELTADATLESDYILLQLFLHQPRRRLESAHLGAHPEGRHAILERQLPDGGFNIYTGGPADVSATVKAYCALKLAALARQRSPALGARAHPDLGRPASRQQLRQDQP